MRLYLIGCRVGVTPAWPKVALIVECYFTDTRYKAASHLR